MIAHPTPPHLARLLALLLGVAGLFAFAACRRGEERPTVVLYTSLNEPTSRAVVSAFEQKTGIAVVLVADTERDKTVGLVQTLLAERDRPRADVFWNSEVAHTLRLKDEGVLEPIALDPALVDEIPEAYRDPEGYWYGFAARARVLIVNTELVPESERPTSIRDLADPRWRGQTAIVRPVTGTTLTHLTALFETLGETETHRFVDALLENECHLPPGNGRLAQLVGEGRIAFGLTDTSDYRLVKATGKPVVSVYPDQEDGGLGTLVIPNSVARVRNGPNPEAAARLIEFLLSREAEEILAFHERGHIPLKPDVPRPDEVKVPGEFRAMTVDFGSVGRQVATRLKEFDERFP